MPNAAMKHEIDPCQEILKQVGPLDDFVIADHDILLAIYQRPEKTCGGIVLTQSNLREDLFQSKAHLVLKVGCAVNHFGTLPIGRGDWVVVRPSDCWDLEVNFAPCRIARQTEFERPIRAVIGSPGLVW